jgi:hypothetical protein
MSLHGVRRFRGVLGTAIAHALTAGYADDLDRPGTLPRQQTHIINRVSPRRQRRAAPC